MLPVRIMTPTRVSIVVVACTVAVAASQAPSEPPRFRVAVDAVSIDAVVTDRTGEVVRDLTAADFDVFQDGKRQKVTLAQFVPVITVAAPAAGGSRAECGPGAPGNAVPPCRCRRSRAIKCAGRYSRRMIRTLGRRHE